MFFLFNILTFMTYGLPNFNYTYIMFKNHNVKIFLDVEYSKLYWKNIIPAVVYKRKQNRNWPMVKFEGGIIVYFHIKVICTYKYFSILLACIYVWYQ